MRCCLKNTVKNNYDSTSDESVTVKKLSADISVTKTSNVYSILRGNDTEVKYRIVVTNSGTQPLTGISVTDALSGFAGTAKVNSASWSHSNGKDKGDIAVTELKASEASLLPAGISLGVGEYITIDLTATINASASGSFKNTANASCEEGKKDTAEAAIIVEDTVPSLSISKRGSFAIGEKYDTVYQIRNSSRYNRL